MTPQFILSTLKCNSVTPKALQLHLQSIKLQKSFYSSNFFSFMCAVMLWYAKFQFFFCFDHYPWLYGQHDQLSLIFHIPYVPIKPLLIRPKIWWKLVNGLYVVWTSVMLVGEAVFLRIRKQVMTCFYIFLIRGSEMQWNFFYHTCILRLRHTILHYKFCATFVSVI
jgi:hypothetical protein